MLFVPPIKTKTINNLFRKHNKRLTPILDIWRMEKQDLQN